MSKLEVYYNTLSNIQQFYSQTTFVSKTKILGSVELDGTEALPVGSAFMGELVDGGSFTVLGGLVDAEGSVVLPVIFSRPSDYVCHFLLHV